MLTSSRQRKAVKSASVAPIAVPVAKPNRTPRAGADAAAKAVLATKKHKQTASISTEIGAVFVIAKKVLFLPHHIFSIS